MPMQKFLIQIGIRVWVQRNTFCIKLLSFSAALTKHHSQSKYLCACVFAKVLGSSMLTEGSQFLSARLKTKPSWMKVENLCTKFLAWAGIKRNYSCNLFSYSSPEPINNLYKLTDQTVASQVSVQFSQHQVSLYICHVTSSSWLN